MQQRAQTPWDPRERQRNQWFWFARELKLMRQIQSALAKAAGLWGSQVKQACRASVGALSLQSQGPASQSLQLTARGIELE